MFPKPCQGVVLIQSLLPLIVGKENRSNLQERVENSNLNWIWHIQARWSVAWEWVWPSPQKSYIDKPVFWRAQWESWSDVGENSKFNGQWKKVLYVCKVCGKGGEHKMNMKRHIEAIHLEGVTSPCNLCENTSRSRLALIMHTCVKNHRDL